MFNSTLVHARGSGRLRKVLRAEKRVRLHPEPARHPSHAYCCTRHWSLSVLRRTELIEPRGAGPGCGWGAHLVEGDFGLVGCKKIVQGRQVGGFVCLPHGRLVLCERSEVWGAGGGGHAAVEAGARGPHGHPHASCVEAHRRVEAVGHRGAHGADHGGGGWEGRDGGALYGGWSRRVGQRQAVQ